MRTLWIVMLAATACETATSDVPVDAAPDAPPVPVVELSSCPAFVAGTIEDRPTMFVPKETTITVGQVVKFVITAEHFVLPKYADDHRPGAQHRPRPDEVFSLQRTGHVRVSVRRP